MDERLRELARRCRARRQDGRPIRQRVAELYHRCVREREGTLLEAAAAAAAVHSLFLSDPAFAAAADPRLAEAFRLAFPNVNPESLRGLDQEALARYLPALKGKYFEVLVRDKLNAGEWVGDIRLAPGQTAVLAESPAQPGWDLQILNPDGSVADALQLKAMHSLSYVKSALERYSDIQVLTTDEVAGAAGDLQDVLASGFSDAELDETVSEWLEALAESPAGSVLDSILSALPFVIITLSEGRCVILGRKSAAAALRDGLERAAKTGAAIGVGALLAHLGAGWLSLPASVLVRLGWDRHKCLAHLSAMLDSRLKVLRSLRVRHAVG